MNNDKLAGAIDVTVGILVIMVIVGVIGWIMAITMVGLLFSVPIIIIAFVGTMCYALFKKFKKRGNQ